MNSDLLEFIAFYTCYIGVGIVWLAIPAFAFYPFVRRLFKGEWGGLYSWVDFCSFLAVHLIWAYGFLHDFNHRGVGMVLDIVVIGGLYGGVVLLRIPFVWRHPEWRTRLAVISLLVLVSAAIALTWFVNLASVE